MENIIYNELRYRGYSVDVGIVEIREKKSDGKEQRTKLEIDFIANKGSERYYIQSAFSISDSEKLNQENRPLVNAPDSLELLRVVTHYISRSYNITSSELLPRIEFFGSSLNSHFF